MTLNTATTTAAAIPPGLILFGRNERQRPHASRFAAGEKAEAERAAGLMGTRATGRARSMSAVTSRSIRHLRTRVVG